MRANRDQRRRRSWVASAYAWLLYLYPEGIRRDQGGDMLELFRDLSRDARRRGRLPWLGLCLRAFWDAARQALRERRRKKPASLAGEGSPSAGRRERSDVVGTFTQDFLYALRGLRRNPLLVAVAVLTLTLGIGANTAVFSIVNGVLLSPLPYQDPEGIVTLWSTWRGQEHGRLSMSEFLDFRDRLDTLEGASAWGYSSVNLSGEGQPPERAAAAFVSPSLLPMLGVSPILGHNFAPEAAQPGKGNRALLSHGLWQSRYGGDPGIIGQAIRANGREVEVAGVLPADFRLPADVRLLTQARILLPLVLDEAKIDRSDRGFHQYLAAARLKPGVGFGQAQAEIRALAQRFTEEGLYSPEQFYGAFLRPVRREVLGALAPALWMLLAAVGFLLLIACANVASLQLTRSDARMREMSLRSALGAGRFRLLRQSLAESLTLALLGGLAGLAAASGLVPLLLAWVPDGVSRADRVGLDSNVLFFTLAASLLTGVLFGLVPALRAARADLAPALREDGPGAAGSVRQRLRSGIVVVQVALCLVLVTAAGLMLRTIWNLYSVDPGIDVEKTASFQVALPSSDYPQASDVEHFMGRLLKRIRAIPGVSQAGAARALAASGPIGDWDFEIQGRPTADGDEPVGDWQVVTPGYFQTLGISVIKGRVFREGDRRDGQRVAIINEKLAQTYFPGENPLGRRIRPFRSLEGSGYATVVGVVENVRQEGLHQPPNAQFYMPLAQWHRDMGSVRRNQWVSVRSEGQPEALFGQLRAALAEIDPRLPPAGMTTMGQVVATRTLGHRFMAILLGSFALAALLLAALGIYGVLAYAVSRRRREIGIRMAMGADSGRVRRMVVSQGLRLAALGVALGAAAALAASRALTAILYQVSPQDPLTFTALPALLLAVALAASYIPARRATRVDPIRALRAD